jgi:hypothetical protein
VSTISEHLAALEMYRTNGFDKEFSTEAYLFTQVHWKDLIAQQSAEEMQGARLVIERRLREQHGTDADRVITKWLASVPKSADAAP